MVRLVPAAAVAFVLLIFSSPVFADANLELVKTAPVAILPNIPFPFTITVTNNGPDPADDVVVTDTLPAGVTLDSINTEQGACGGDPVIVCNLGTILNGESVGISMTVRTSSETGRVENTAAVTSSDPDPDVTNNSDTADPVVLGSVDMSIVKTAPALVIPNEPFPFTITVTNNGPAIATFVSVSDTLPASVELLSAATTQGSCAGDPNVVCNLGLMDPGEEATITLSVRTPLASGTIENTATVAASLDQTELNAADNSDSTSSQIDAAAGVPTLSEWMLFVLASMLGLVAVVKMRH